MPPPPHPLRLDTSDPPSSRGRTPDGHGVLDDALAVPGRVADVAAAWERACQRYVREAIVRRLGEDFHAVIDGLLVGLLVALGGLLTTTLLGAAIGGGVGALAGGVGAGPGAAFGARVGFAVGQWLLEWLGVAFLLAYLAEHLGELSAEFAAGLRLAWDARGSAAAIDAAARHLADGVALFFSLLVQGLVLYLTKAASEGRLAAALEQLRGSRLFRGAARMEEWLGANFARLRAKYVPLRWQVLAESAERIPGTSIPERLRLRVGSREFDVSRNAAKIGPEGKPIGPATKHLGERAARSLDSVEPVPPTAKNPNPPPRTSSWPKSEWAKAAEVDFPISSLASALDQAEAQLIFRPPGSHFLRVEGWELGIDTTGPVWKVYHAVYR
jgi:hypothetical protein